MTKLDDAQGCRNEQPLKWRGSLWYFEDDSMYAYYTPTHWRPLTESEKIMVTQKLKSAADHASKHTADLIAEIEKDK